MIKRNGECDGEALLLHCFFLMVTAFSAVDSRPVIPPEMVTKDLIGFWSFDQTTIKGKAVNTSGRRIMAPSKVVRKVSKVNLVKRCRLTVKRIWWKSHIMPV